MKWGDVKPGHAFVSANGEFHLLIGVTPSTDDAYAGTDQAGKQWLDLLYLIVFADDRIHFWHDHRCAEYDVVSTDTTKQVWP